MTAQTKDGNHSGSRVQCVTSKRRLTLGLMGMDLCIVWGTIDVTRAHVSNALKESNKDMGRAMMGKREIDDAMRRLYGMHGRQYVYEWHGSHLVIDSGDLERFKSVRALLKTVNDA